MLPLDFRIVFNFSILFRLLKNYPKIKWQRILKSSGTISTKKTEFMFQPAPKHSYYEPNIQREKTSGGWKLFLSKQHLLMLCKPGCRDQKQIRKSQKRIWAPQKDSLEINPPRYQT